MLKTTRLCGALALAYAGLHAGAVYAQEGQKLERVEITGSSIKRISDEASLPVTVVTKADIERSGVQNTEQLIDRISAVSSAGGQVAAGVSGLATYGLSAVSMRGLGSQRTLVLVNGRRLAVFAGSGSAVNVNAIPLAAIERVEVLQDGASGVYGSDAIAGVMNFILRQNYDGVELSASYGEPTRGGGGRNRKASVVGGFGNYDRDRFSVVLSAAMEKESNMLGAERSYTKSDTNIPYYEGGATETGRIEGAWLFPGQITDISEPGPNTRSADNPYGISNTGYGNPMAAAGKCADIGMRARSGKGLSQGFTPGLDADGNPADVASKTAPNCTFDTGPFVGLVPNRDYYGASGSLRFKLSESQELFAEALVSRNKSVNPIQPAPTRQAFNQGNTNFKGSGVDPILLIYPQNPNYKIAADYLNSIGLGAMVGKPLGVSQRTFLMGPRTTSDTADQGRLVLGTRGTLADLDYELAYTYNRSKTDGAVIDGFGSIFGLHKVLNDPASNWNPWAPLGKQPDDVQAKLEAVKYKGPTMTSKSINQGLDARISGSLMELGGGPLGFAAGMVARDEQYKLTPAPILGTGDLLGQGTAVVETDGRRSVWAMFGEVNAPFTKSLEGNVALRSDSYSDFGRTTNAKASLRWQPMKELMVRSSAGTGFRAPTLVDLFQPQQIGSTEQFVDPKFPGNGPIQVVAVTGGNPHLKAEESKQFSIGMVFQPFSSLTGSLDYFQVNVDNAIATPTALQLVAGFRRGAPGFADFVTTNPSGEITKVNQLPANVSAIKTAGFDLDLRYREKLWDGRLDVGLNGTYMSKYDLTNASGELEKSVGSIVRPDGAPLVAAATGVILRWKHTLSVGYSYGPFSGALSQRYYKGYEMARDLDNNRQFVKGQSTYDLVMSYNVIKNAKLTLGVRNLLDRDPPLFIHNGSQFQAGYDVYQEDPRGRFVYVQASYKF
ncbi:TonB-dependent receptor [Paucibacter soli]|uniref:TonB-dependent receptor n=1 Tax=Paucibacter soli TaxID=3133433 RepID=UPI0030B70EFD